VRALAIAVLGLAVSACTSSIGNSCSLDDPCDDGVCNLSGPGAAVCVDADGDVDGDGLPNKRDFCNQQAGGEFDEDGDGLGDACDPCPIARPPASPDRDGDAVDSPCDPDPTVAGDEIKVFEGFNGALPASWRKEGGAWEVRGGEAIFTAADPTTEAILTAPLSVSSRHLALIASYRVDRLDQAATENFAGVTSITRLPLGMSSVTCTSSHMAGADTLNAESTAAGVSSAPFPNLFDPAGLYRIAARIDNAMGGCAIVANALQGATTTTAPTEAPTEAGLTARALTARFQYLLVVQRPN
jgi:hypothetical protein